jgi:putative membrane protein
VDGGPGHGTAGDDDDDPGGRAEPRLDARFSYANERTFLAWNRTALALITAGLAITQLLPPFTVPGGRRVIGLPLIVLGSVVALYSLYQWHRNERAMRAGEPLPSSPLPGIVAVVIGVCALLALVYASMGGVW